MHAEERERIEQATIDWILAARAEYLAGGAKVLSHWDALHTRLRAGASTSCDVATWCTSVARGLRLEAPSMVRARATQDLARAVGDHASTWLQMLETEHGYLMAMARLQAEKRRKDRDALRDEIAALDNDTI